MNLSQEDARCVDGTLGGPCGKHGRYECIIGKPQCVDSGDAHPSTLDQANTANWRAAAINIVPVNQDAQTFTPSMGCLMAVEIGLKTGNRGRGGDIVSVSIDSDTNPSGSGTLAHGSSTVSEGFDGFLRFAWPGGIPVQTGSVLRLRVFDTGKNVCIWKYTDGNPYPKGGAFSGAMSSPNNSDFIFRTLGSPSCD
jgi:hypothetical protein